MIGALQLFPALTAQAAPATAKIVPTRNNTIVKRFMGLLPSREENYPTASPNDQGIFISWSFPWQPGGAAMVSSSPRSLAKAPNASRV